VGTSTLERPESAGRGSLLGASSAVVGSYADEASCGPSRRPRGIRAQQASPSGPPGTAPTTARFRNRLVIFHFVAEFGERLRGAGIDEFSKLARHLVHRAQGVLEGLNVERDEDIEFSTRR